MSELIATSPDRRTINWIMDPVGNCGKTTYCFSLALQRKDFAVLSGKAADMMFAIKQMVQDNRAPTVIGIDIPRSLEEYVSYGGIEKIKDGLFFAAKYESSMVQYNPPHVIVFANFEPDQSKMSADRWNIKVITPEFDWRDWTECGS